MIKAAIGRGLLTVWGVLVLCGTVPGMTWGASEADLRIKPGPDADLVINVCSACHSIDYVQTNSVFLDRNGWTGTVNKMVNVFGAPAKPEEVSKIVDYLARNYGK